MNWLTRVAIFFGRKKFEEFAQANPQLPDDALAVANTLDTYPVRGAATLIAGSLAHAADNVLRGTETVEQLATQALLILAAVCLIWVRHAISKHDVSVNAALQKARTISGITTQVGSLAVAFATFVFFVVNPPTVKAQTNAPMAETNGSPGGSPSHSVSDLFTQLVTDIGHSTRFSSGVGVNLHAKLAPLLSQELSLFGETTTNSTWSTGPSHATFFLARANEEQLGWSVSGSWSSPPRLLRLALFNASDIDWTINWGLPVEDYYNLFRHADWRDNRLGLSVTRRF